MCRNTSRWIGFGLVAAGLGLTWAGCSNRAGNCALNAEKQAADGACIEGAAGGSGGNVPAGCDPSTATGPVDDTCGVFVSPSGDDDTGKGTKEQPLKTLTKALSKGATIYACASSAAFTEAVTLDKAVTLFGGLDCSKGWAYDATKKTQLTAAADQVPLTLASSARGSEVRDFAIAAVDANADGGSSVAVLDDHADLALENVDVTAGAGKEGAAGATQDQVQTPTGGSGGDGTDNSCGSTANAGGNGGQNTCTDNGNTNDVSGGPGGGGTNGSAGSPGLDGSPSSTTTGNGGKPQDANGPCATGSQGAPGKPGEAGDGARGIGDIDASGFHGVEGSKGKTAGLSGQGGGGGGGAAKCAGGGSGPGGGGGGAGGCGGAVGNAGQPGGSSIGILALGATLTLKSVAITTKDGGAGGLGGDGQRGGAGGQQGNQGGAGACPGGVGGQGGRGGCGGGGTGGHSAAIAIKGGKLPDLDSTTITLGKGGLGGNGGDGDTTPQTKGDDGLACKTLDFADAKSCVQ